MRIEIRKHRDGQEKVVIISFDTLTEKFDSDYDRNKFFRGLHGWEQQVPKGNKVYRYHRPGLLDEVPHAKIADSVFMIMEENMKQVMEYFEQWSRKVEVEMLQVMMERARLAKMMRARQEEETEDEVRG